MTSSGSAAVAAVVAAGAAAGRVPPSAASTSRSLRMRPSLSMHARSMTLRSSRMLPVQGALFRSRSALGLSPPTRLLEPRGELLDEGRRQVGDVVAPLAQRRQRNLDDVQAVVEILAEAARRHLLREPAVGGGDEAHVDLAAVGRADALHFAVLDDAEQLRLDRHRQLADLVEEQRRAVRLFEEARLRLDRRR